MRGIAGVLLGCFIVGCAPARPAPEPASEQPPAPAPSAEPVAPAAAPPEPDAPREKLSEIGKNAPAVGDVVPDFELPDQDGKPVSLAAALDSGPVILVFYRGDW